MINWKKKNARFGKYPSCDLLNCALRLLIEDKPDAAFKEIVHAITKANGYFYDNLKEEIVKRMNWEGIK